MGGLGQVFLIVGSLALWDYLVYSGCQDLLVHAR